MGLEHRTFTFHASDVGGVVAEMAELARIDDGSAWLNVKPDVDENEVHTGSLFFRMLSNRGPVIPVFTYVPEHDNRGRRMAPEVGLLHATGRDAVGRLRAGGVEIPEEWILGQDHTKRGIIAAVPPDEDLERVLRFGLDAIPILSPFGFEGYYEARFSRR